MAHDKHIHMPQSSAFGLASAVRTLCAVLIALPSTTWAWGADGHRLIADLAYDRLPPSTRERVDAILAVEPGATLPSISTWADEVRSPTTAPWHYTNFGEEQACRYNAAKNCPDGQCVVGALERQTERLTSATVAEDQLKALKWVVHLVGDVHQPLHAGISGDKGGNMYQVRAFGRGTNLHSIWDSGLIKRWPGGLPELRSTAAAAQSTRRPPSPPAGWAEESCRIVSSPEFYPDGRFITEAYQERWSPVIASRLATAADRLAALLTRALP